ncbi:MAG: hypothetical protein RLZZ284_1358 [Actinomycetota bacterium]
MKMFLFVVMLYLLVPGSGQLRWNGIPMSSRLEFATLALYVLVLAQRVTRRYLRTKWEGFSWRGVVVPVVVMFSFAKLLTFAWSPFGDGFDACYRSLYYPLENPNACEKSYEGPFLRQSDLGLSNTSRTDRTVDFGVHQYDWSLPFMNEYPRLGSQWLQRFPFTAKFGARVTRPKGDEYFLPILGNGELKVTLGSEQLVNQDLLQAGIYEFPRLYLVRMPRGTSELVVDYTFRDDENEIPPDEGPPPRGPYASLKIGTPQRADEILSYANVQVRGWVFDSSLAKTPSAVAVLDGDGNELARTPMSERPDVASFFQRPTIATSGFLLEIPASALQRGALRLQAEFSGNSVTIGSVKAGSRLIPDGPQVETAVSQSVQAGFSAWLDASRDSIVAYEPDGRRDYGIRFDFLALLVEAFSALVFLTLLWVLLRSLGLNLLFAGGLAVIGWIAVHGVGVLIPPIKGVDLLVPFMILAAAVVAATRWLRARPSVIYLPLAVVLAHHETFDHLRRFHFSQGVRWWGRLLYWWRDSDWYATRGFARTIFTEGSLQGGHAVFWFQAGPRYWAFITQVLLGEQDVLIGLLMVSAGFFAVLFLVSQFLLNRVDKISASTAWLVLVIGLVFQADDMFTGFGFVGSSEHPTWIVLFAVTGYLLVAREESRTWLLVGLSALVAYMAPMRPNQIGGIIVLFVLLLTVVSRQVRAQWISRTLRMTAAFSIVISLALLHNLYYGESFVPFAANASINVKFEWTKLLADNSFFGAIDVVWTQVRAIFYWGWPVNWNWALVFWGSQVVWLVALVQRVRHGGLRSWRTLTLLLPLAYALPMLKFELGSYYPRHLVVISLSCLCAGLLAWSDDRQESETGKLLDGNPQVDDGSTRGVGSVESGIAQLA